MLDEGNSLQIGTTKYLRSNNYESFFLLQAKRKLFIWLLYNFERCLYSH